MILMFPGETHGGVVRNTSSIRFGMIFRETESYGTINGSKIKMAVIQDVART
jgi:hypothetical protein